VVVHAAVIEPVSAAQFPANREMNRGIPPIQGAFITNPLAIAQINGGLQAIFPTEQNREISTAFRDLSSGISFFGRGSRLRQPRDSCKFTTSDCFVDSG
jgi:hypothetical protein